MSERLVQRTGALMKPTSRIEPSPRSHLYPTPVIKAARMVRTRVDERVINVWNVLEGWQYNVEGDS